MPPFLFWQSIKKEVISPKSIALILIIALFYFSFSTLALNYKLVWGTIFGSYDVTYKIGLIALLIKGSREALSRIDFLLLVITSILVGINILLVLKIIRNLKYQGTKVSLSIGGSSIIGIIATGCSSCGLSILSIMGFSASLAFMPFRGIWLHFVAILLLALSIYYSIRVIYYSITCKIK